MQGFTPALDGVEVGFERVGLWFIRRLIAALRDQGESPDDVVFTVPVNSFELYRQWLLAGCSELEAARIQLLDESTAAALGYGLENGQTVLVIDFGGGTLDLSLVQPAVPEQSPDGFLLKWGRKLFAGKDSAPRTPPPGCSPRLGATWEAWTSTPGLPTVSPANRNFPKGRCCSGSPSGSRSGFRAKRRPRKFF